MRLQALMLATLGLLAGCASPERPNPVGQPLGLLKVTISGIGEGASPTATAEWVTGASSGASSKPGISGQAATIVPVNGSNALGDVQLIRRLVSFDDDDVAGIRYVRATFDIVNRSTTIFNNFTLYAVNAPGNLGGTGIIGMTAGTGVAISDPNIARGFKPTHGMRPSVTSLKVNEDNADLQFFSPAEAATMQSQGLTTLDPFNPPNNILPVGSTVLEYGFVARNLSGGRAIASPDTGTPSNCTTDACKGTVTLAYQFPKVSPRNANPFSFSLYFLVANEDTSIGSQSVEEQTPNTVMGLSSGSVSSFAQIRTLFGSTFLSSNQNHFCRVRTAIGPDLFLGPDPIPTAPGSLDECFFGVGGKVTTDFGSGDDQARDLAIYPNDVGSPNANKIVLAGRSSNGSNDDFALARYNPNGSLDTSFDTDGKVTTAVGTGTDIAHSLTLYPNDASPNANKVVLAGYSINGGSPDFALVRYNLNGTLDNTFDGDGKLTTSFGTVSDQASSVAIQSDGKIVAGGFAFMSNFDFALARYNPSGSLDTGFDGDGIVTTNFLGSSHDTANALAIQPDGKIVLAGSSGSDSALARYNVNGSLDATFDLDGKVTTSMGGGNDAANAIAILADGKIVVAGRDGNGNFGLARYNTNGSLDTSFDTDGIQTTDLGSVGDEANAIAIQSSGKIVVAGTSNSDFALARYNSDGSLDTSFGSGGIQTTDFALGNDQAYSLALKSDGKIMVAGLGNSDFALARYNP